MAETSPKKTKVKIPASKRKWIVLGSVLGVLLLLVGAATLFYLDKLNKISYVPSQSPVVDTSISIPPEEGDIPPAEGAPAANPIELPEGDVFAEKDIINILLLGTDELTAEFNENARADSIMLLSFNKKTDNVKLVSFQRGLGVPVPGRPDDWLTHTFRYGGADLTAQTIEECFAIQLDGYVRVNFYTFEQIVNTVGGVDVTLTELEAQGLNGEVPTNAKTRQKVKAGQNHLSGFDALQYARIRFIDDDWHRIVRQRTVIKSIAQKSKSLSLLQLNALADTVLPLVQTNLTKGQITSLLFVAPQFMGADIQDMSLPAEGTFYGAQMENGQVLNMADFEANRKILHDFLQQ